MSFYLYAKKVSLFFLLFVKLHFVAKILKSVRLFVWEQMFCDTQGVDYLHLRYKTLFFEHLYIKLCVVDDEVVFGSVEFKQLFVSATLFAGRFALKHLRCYAVCLHRTKTDGNIACAILIVNLHLFCT